MSTRNQKIQAESIPFREEEHKAKDANGKDKSGTETEEIRSGGGETHKEESLKEH